MPKKPRKVRPGDRFGFLTVIHKLDWPANKSRQGTLWLCRCLCGNETAVEEANLVRGHTRSCCCMPNWLQRKQIWISRDCENYVSLWDKRPVYRSGHYFRSLEEIAEKEFNFLPIAVFRRTFGFVLEVGQSARLTLSISSISIFRGTAYDYSPK